MKVPDLDTNIIEHLSEGAALRLIPLEKRESLLPDPKLKAVIEEMKGKQKRVKVEFDDGHEAA